MLQDTKTRSVSSTGRLVRRKRRSFRSCGGCKGFLITNRSANDFHTLLTFNRPKGLPDIRAAPRATARSTAFSTSSVSIAETRPTGRERAARLQHLRGSPYARTRSCRPTRSPNKGLNGSRRRHLLQRTKTIRQAFIL